MWFKLLATFESVKLTASIRKLHDNPNQKSMDLIYRVCTPGQPRTPLFSFPLEARGMGILCISGRLSYHYCLLWCARVLSFNFWVCEWNSYVWPFKWKLYWSWAAPWYVLFIMLYKVISSFESVDEIPVTACVTIQIGKPLCSDVLRCYLLCTIKFPYKV